MKYAVITGCDRGLGIEFVKVMLEKGYQVFAGCLSQERGELQALLRKYPTQLTLVVMNIALDESVLEAAKQIKEQTSQIDLLINNAGTLGDIEKSILDPLDFKDILNVINVNALGSLRVTNALVDLVIQSDLKCIVNISSEAGSIEQNNRESWYGYAMSKAAMNMEGALIQQKLAPLHVKVLQIHPGWVKTYMRGEEDSAATYEPKVAAEKIVEVIFNHLKNEVTYQPEFIDLNGDKLPW